MHTETDCVEIVTSAGAICSPFIEERYHICASRAREVKILYTEDVPIPGRQSCARKHNLLFAENGFSSTGYYVFFRRSVFDSPLRRRRAAADIKNLYNHLRLGLAVGLSLPRSCRAGGAEPVPPALLSADGRPPAEKQRRGTEPPP